MKNIEVKDIRQNVFSAIGQEWMLLTAGDRTKANTMTASWGGMGVLWNKNVVTVYVRPQRYTFEFLEQGDYFTVAFFDGAHKDALKLCGSKSGREVDKVKECGFTLAYGAGDAPYFEEAKLVLVCKKVYCDDLDPKGILEPQVVESVYAAGDFHRMYVGEIVEVLEG